MRLSEFWVSAALTAEVEGMAAAEILGAAPLSFDAGGDLRLPVGP
jgi:hypothetical protein